MAVATEVNYNDAKVFNPKWYLNRYFAPKTSLPCSNSQKSTFSFTGELVKMINFPEVTGTTLLDVGCGPTLYTAMAESSKFTEIVLSEFSAANRQEVIKWLANDADKFDWSVYSQKVKQNEEEFGKDHTGAISVQEIESRTRAAVKSVVPIDVNLSNPLNPDDFLSPKQQFDCLSSTLCLEAACLTFEAFQNAIKNLSGLLRPGGHFILTGVLGQTYYKVNDDIFFPTLTLELSQIKLAFQICGFSIIYEKEVIAREVRVSTSCQEDDDHLGKFAILARKEIIREE